MTTPPDFLTDFKDWAIAHPDLTANVVWRFPKQPVYPIILLHGAGRVRLAGEAPFWSQRLAYQVWTNDDAQFTAIKNLADALCGALDDITSMTVIGTSLVRSVTGTSCDESPDPDTGWPRFIVNTRITATHI